MITDDGFINFIKSPVSHNLRFLDISNTQISDKSIYALASAEECCSNQLASLKTSNCVDITEKSLIEFINSPNSQSIQLLDFSGLDLTDLIMFNISFSCYMNKLIALYVNNCPKITFDSLDNLGKSPYLLFLGTLELSQCLKV